MDENNWIEVIEFEISISIGTNDFTYEYNDEFWDKIWLFIFNHSHMYYSVFDIFLFELLSP